jgi:hypothetical protein
MGLPCQCSSPFASTPSASTSSIPMVRTPGGHLELSGLRTVCPAARAHVCHPATFIAASSSAPQFHHRRFFSHGCAASAACSGVSPRMKLLRPLALAHGRGNAEDRPGSLAPPGIGQRVRWWLLQWRGLRLGHDGRWIPDGGRWCKSDIDPDGGRHKKKPRRHVSPGLRSNASRWMGGDEGSRGSHPAVCLITRAAIEFPRMSERPRDGRRCHTGAGGGDRSGPRCAGQSSVQPARLTGAREARRRSHWHRVQKRNPGMSAFGGILLQKYFEHPSITNL